MRHITGETRRVTVRHTRLQVYFCFFLIKLNYVFNIFHLHCCQFISLLLLLLLTEKSDVSVCPKSLHLKHAALLNPGYKN